MTKWTSTLLALVVLVAVVSVHASPIGDGATNKVMQGRQDSVPTAEVVVNPAPVAAPAAPVAPAATDDDDDEDDDDYGLGLDDDDDDEEEEAEDDDDDDDDDYLERFFDDILADDDDEDEVTPKPKPPKPVKPAKPVTVATSAPVTELAAVANNAPASNSDDEDEDYDEDSVAASSNDVNKGEESDEEEEEEEPAEKDEDSDEANVESDEEEETENDEAENDEAENDEAEEYEDEDESDDILAHKRSRALSTGTKQHQKTPKMPVAHLDKYNRFVDSIVDRINEVLKKSFDPVTVKLTRGSPAAPPPSRKPMNEPKLHQLEPKIGDEGPTYELVAASRAEDISLSDTSEQRSVSSSDESTNQRARPNKNKNGNKQNRQRARATLIGLSSLRRDGDVTVNTMSEHTTVRSRFLLGPLVLRVEKQFGRGAKKELRSATATTDKMTGRMVLRINQSGVATLHSMRVLQPKQVRVESDDDHDRTREFVWRRSSHIASLVSQKLTKAVRDLLTKEARST